MNRQKACQSFIACIVVLAQCTSSPGQTKRPNIQKTQSAPIRQSQSLQATSKKILTVPVFGFYGVPWSDDNGNLYLQPAAQPDSAIFKLSQLNESDSKMIPAPPDRSCADDSGLVSILNYAVTPSGTLYMLAEDAKHQFHVFGFDSDGNVKHDTKLEISENIYLLGFAVFDNDTILASGYYARDAPETVRGKSYAAMFDESGQLLKDMASRFSLDAISLDPAVPVNSIYIRPGKDGNLYLLKPSTVLVISAGGEIVRRIKFVKPDPVTQAMGLYVADGLLAIQLGELAIGKPIHPKYLVLNTTTGKEYGYFVPSEAVKGRLVRFSSEEGFVFMSNEKNKFVLVTANMN